MKQTIKIIRSNRRTISLEITRTGDVLVRAPRHMSEAKIQQFVRDKSGWLQKHLQKRETEQEALKEVGRFTEQEIKKLQALAKQVFPEKVAYYARLIRKTSRTLVTSVMG